MNDISDYLRDRYVEELDRFHHIENKCFRLMRFLTFVFGFLVFISSWAVRVGFEPRVMIDWMSVLSASAVLLCIASSWGHCLSGLRLMDTSSMPRTRQTLEYLRYSDSDESIDYMHDCYIDTLESLAIQVDSKSKNFELAYKDLVCAAWCSTSLILLVIIGWLS
jgi:hypothetical protein